MHQPPVSGHYVDDEVNTSKPLCTESYNSNMGFVDRSNMMANNYSITQKPWKSTKKLFFYIVDLTILNTLYNSLIHQTISCFVNNLQVV
jgi:hypothetical protein